MSELSGRDRQLLAVLKEHRLQLARQKGVPAYVIFSDKSLADMAHKRPSTLDEFAEVKGVGKNKLQQFGDIFLQVIASQN